MIPTPQPLLEILTAIGEQTDKLKLASENLGVSRQFTLDGRLVGDIGEMLAAAYLKLELDAAQRGGHDAVTEIDGKERHVQVKCRKESRTIAFSSVPDMLVVIWFKDDWTEWKFIYNGDGSPVRDRADLEGCEVDATGQIWKNGHKAKVDLRVGPNTVHRSHSTDVVPAQLEPIDLFVSNSAAKNDPARVTES